MAVQLRRGGGKGPSINGKKNPVAIKLEARGHVSMVNLCIHYLWSIYILLIGYLGVYKVI